MNLRLYWTKVKSVFLPFSSHSECGFRRVKAAFMVKLSVMTEKEKAAMQSWVNNWEEVGRVLDRLRYQETRNIDITKEILSLSDASVAAIKMYPPKATSGLIEMQRYFMKLKK